MRVRPTAVVIVLNGCLFTLLTVVLIASRSVEEFIKSRTQVPMAVIPEVEVPEVETNDGLKTIVWVDTYHNNHGLRNSISNAKFFMCKGEANKCKILPHVIVEPNQTELEIRGDAVIFQACHLNQIARPQRQSPNQIFVLAERENWLGNAYDAMESKQSNYDLFKDAFNWTMSYRGDSDISFPYGEVKKSEDSVKKRDFRGVYKKKKYDAVWFVSHCSTQSHREVFVRELQKYITVHVYGACGNYSCPRHRSQRDDKNCMTVAIEQHKFVLSFENSYRPNYVTEKLFDWFPRDIVPVVRGGGGDYAQYGIPEGTIIDEDAYSSAKELALFLKTVGSDEGIYTEYLKRKQGYYVVSIDKKQTEGYCELCEMLQDVDKYRKSYLHIGAWWDSELFSETYTDWHKVKAVYCYIVICNVIMSVVVCKCFVGKLLHQRA